MVLEKVVPDIEVMNIRVACQGTVLILIWACFGMVTQVLVFCAFRYMLEKFKDSETVKKWANHITIGYYVVTVAITGLFIFLECNELRHVTKELKTEDSAPLLLGLYNVVLQVWRQIIIREKLIP